MIATVLMVVITVMLSATVVVMVMSFNSSGGGVHYGSFTTISMDGNNQYTFYFGTFTPKTAFSEVKASVAGQLTPALNICTKTTPGNLPHVASLYAVDLAGDGHISIGDSLVINFYAEMANKVADVLIVFIADGNVIAGTSIIVGGDPTPQPIPTDYTYNINAGKATITGYRGVGGAISLPVTDGAGHPVIAVWGGAFNSVQGHLITSVIIPSSITSIGGAAFQSCALLTSVTMGSGLTSIGNSVFRGCTALTQVEIRTGVISIGNSAFRDCSALTSIIIPDTVTTIAASAFQLCSSLTSIRIGSGVTSIGDYAFQSCSALTTMTIPNTVTSIGVQIFYYCTKLVTVNIGNGVTAVKAASFLGCGKLSSVSLGTGVTSIAEKAFYSCSALTSIIFRGLVAPMITNIDWIQYTNAGISGHAYAASNFPPPGSTFNGLKMGTHL